MRMRPQAVEAPTGLGNIAPLLGRARDEQARRGCLSRGAFRPGPGGYAPSIGELAKRDRKYCARLRDLLTAQLERQVAGMTT